MIRVAAVLVPTPGSARSPGRLVAATSGVISSSSSLISLVRAFQRRASDRSAALVPASHDLCDVQDTEMGSEWFGCSSDQRMELVGDCSPMFDGAVAGCSQRSERLDRTGSAPWPPSGFTKDDRSSSRDSVTLI